ncbi:MAG: TetR family transcriptional regulator [Solirubrobacterales bacterium]|nr:TetR family transcriptional regulator [Solirubrobacterales bacterium]
MAATPRRLSREARRLQLVGVAMAIAADEGFPTLSLDKVAERSGVTRNLLYHYFPRGRQDLVIAVADEAGRRLADEWVTDESLSRDERLAANFTRTVDHAYGPSDEWQVYRQARTYADDEARATSAAYIERVVSAIALNNTGTADPPPLLRMAIHGFLAYAETALEQARDAGLDREPVLAVLARTLIATVAAAQAAEQVE